MEKFKFKNLDEDLEAVLKTLKDFKPYRPCLQIIPQNWKSIVYTAVILAIKYWDDRYFWNMDVVDRLKIFDIHHTSKWEHMALEIL